MEVGPTTHYVMGGIRVDAETRRDDRARTVRGGRGRRRDARRQPARRQLAVGPARVRGPDRARGRRARRRRRRSRTSIRSWSAARPRELAAPLERTEGEDPYAIQRDLQDDDAAAGRHLPRRGGPDRGPRPSWPSCARRWTAVRATGGRAYNPGWNLVFELGNLLTVSEAITRSALRADRESRRAQPARPPGHRRGDLGRRQQRRPPRPPTGRCRSTTAPLPAMTDELRGLLGSSDH